MDQLIKHRIEQIHKGEIPDGYKKIANEVLPVDWKVVTLKKLGKIKRGASPRPIKSFVTKDKDAVNWIKIGDVQNGKIRKTEEKITLEGAKKSVAVSKGDLLLSNSMSYGKPYILEIDGCIHDGWLTIKVDENVVEKKYLVNYLSSNKPMKFYYTMAAGSGVKNLNKDLVSELPILFPQVKEQRKIVRTLTAWDNVIGLKEKILSYKKQQKNSAIQNLTSGKMRFREFTNPWITTKIGKRLEFIKGDVVDDPQNYPLLSVRLYLKGIELTTKRPNATENGRSYYFRNHGELIIGRQNFHNGGMAMMPKTEQKYVASNAISSLKSINGDLKFYYYYLSNPNFYKRVGHIIGGTGQKEISETDFKKLTITVPSDDVEMKKITEVLDIMSRDIELEEKELEQLKEQKKGLVQLLLSGIVRVKVS